jgi:hypothetical protein
MVLQALEVTAADVGIFWRSLAGNVFAHQAGIIVLRQNPAV